MTAEESAKAVSPAAGQFTSPNSIIRGLSQTPPVTPLLDEWADIIQEECSTMGLDDALKTCRARARLEGS